MLKKCAVYYNTDDRGKGTTNTPVCQYSDNFQQVSFPMPIFSNFGFLNRQYSKLVATGFFMKSAKINVPVSLEENTVKG
jgi:hypothetical protein